MDDLKPRYIILRANIRYGMHFLVSQNVTANHITSQSCVSSKVVDSGKEK